MSKDSAGPPESDRFDGAPHPRETNALFGHGAAEFDLLDAYRRNRLAQAWIVGGLEGIGKATLAWRFARFLLAFPDPAAPAVQQATTLAVAPDHPAARRIATLALADVSLLRRGWNEKDKKHRTEIRVDEVREASRAFRQASGTGGWRVCIIDSADDLNRNAANALLKLIEEPPERALFLLVAHQPGRILPTIRSRCRKLLLGALTQDEIVGAVAALGPPWSDRPPAEIAAAAARAEGSVRETLRLLSGEAMAFDATVARLFERLPQVDWFGVHMLADKLNGRDNEAAYEAFMRALEHHVDRRVRGLSQRGAGPGRLIGYARAWEDIQSLARETEVLNFDKKAMLLSVFDRLAEAERQAA